MRKNKKFKKIIILIIIFSLLTVFVPQDKGANAASLTNAKDTLSTSQRDMVATHTVTFTTGTTTPASGVLDVTLDPAFSDFAGADVTCATGTSARFAARDARCTLAGALPATSTQITIRNVYNPDPGALTPTSYLVHITTYKADLVTILERVDVRVAILDVVIVSATVLPTLQFTVGNTATGTVINNVPTTGFAATSSLSFGNLNVAASSTLGQQLWVTTNADEGYVVTVQQNHELLDNSSSTINSFDNSMDYTGSTTPHAWNSPMGILDQPNTYGHMGLTSDDATLNWGAGNNPFNAGLGAPFYAGLNWTAPLEIMSHTGPADGSTQNKGYAKIAYTIRISSLQEAGDYTNTLTYICTPTY